MFVSINSIPSSSTELLETVYLYALTIV